MKLQDFLIEYKIDVPEKQFEKFLDANAKKLSIYYTKNIKGYLIEDGCEEYIAKAYFEQPQDIPQANSIISENPIVANYAAANIKSDDQLLKYIKEIAVSTQETAKWVKFWSIITIIGFCLAILLSLLVLH